MTIVYEWVAEANRGLDVKLDGGVSVQDGPVVVVGVGLWGRIFEFNVCWLCCRWSFGLYAEKLARIWRAVLGGDLKTLVGEAWRTFAGFGLRIRWVGV